MIFMVLMFIVFCCLIAYLVREEERKEQAKNFVDFILQFNTNITEYQKGMYELMVGFEKAQVVFVNFGRSYMKNHIAHMLEIQQNAIVANSRMPDMRSKKRRDVPN